MTLSNLSTLIPIIIVYNALMLAVDFQALSYFFRHRRPMVWLAAVTAVGGTGFVLALILSALWTKSIGFPVMYLGSWLIFFHGPLLLAGAAAAVWKASRPLAGTFAALGIAVVLVAVYAFLIEPFRLEVTTYSVSSPKVERPTRIVVISDIQTDGIGQYERDVLRRAVDQEPDLILLAGDYLQQRPLSPELVRDFRTLLRESGLTAPLGVYAVKGDIDLADWAEFFRDLPVTVMEGNQTRNVSWLRLTSLGAGESHMAGLVSVPARIPQTDEFHIVLGHAPDFALGYAPADLLVAGHTHGGQVQLPFIGPLVTMSRVPRDWAAGGLVKLDGDRTLVVSRGIGMERGWAPRLRFLCPPQLVVIDLKPAG
jgi:predicted MPP superfamily phosphohydrolase